MVGQTSSHDRILEKLRGDSMGVVYRTEDAKLRHFIGLESLAKPVSILIVYSRLPRPVPTALQGEG
jgi:hypothetical protein